MNRLRMPVATAINDAINDGGELLAFSAAAAAASDEGDDDGVSVT